MMYDYLLVGAGLFNAVFAYEAAKDGKKCLVLEKRNHIGGNCYTEKIDGIDVHKYGAHIFRTSDISIWKYMEKFSSFNNFINSPIAKYGDEVYNLPFNMNTFAQMWGISTPADAKSIIEKQSAGVHKPARNLEEHAIGMVGIDIYEKLIKGYTEKQWGKPCSELPASIMRRIPLRFIYDNNYFSQRYQGIPELGYTKIMEQMFADSDVKLNTDYLEDREFWNKQACTVVFTGTIDSYYSYCFGPLEYRSLRFETETIDIENYQGVAVVNYTKRDVPYTRVIEHKHFMFGNQKKTIISREYPVEWKLDLEPYYPINDKANNERYQAYLQKAQMEKNIVFGGRLGSYQYYDMEDTIKAAMTLYSSVN